MERLFERHTDLKAPCARLAINHLAQDEIIAHLDLDRPAGRDRLTRVQAHTPAGDIHDSTNKASFGIAQLGNRDFLVDVKTPFLTGIHAG